MKKSIRLCVMALALTALCGGLLAYRFNAAECADLHQKEKASPAADTPRALPMLPGMRFFTRGSAAL